MRGQLHDVKNILLRLLTTADFALICDSLVLVQFPVGEILATPNIPGDMVYFIESGIVSQTVISREGRRLEIGLYGREGVGPVEFTLGVDMTPHRHVVRGRGAAYRIEAAVLSDAVRRSPTLRLLLLRYAQAFMIQIAYTAFSNGIGTIEERLTRWLLMCHDRLDSDCVDFTHDAIAGMLGVRRAGVTNAMHILEGEHLLRTSRGRVLIVNRAKLEAASGSNYGVPEAEYERLIGAFRQSPVSTVSC